VRRIMRLMRSWERAALIATSGKRDGGLGGRMGGVGERKSLERVCIVLAFWYCRMILEGLQKTA
jgi:hypothetical protein